MLEAMTLLSNKWYTTTSEIRRKTPRIFSSPEISASR
jgi:hypothetical protein